MQGVALLLVLVCRVHDGGLLLGGRGLAGGVLAGRSAAAASRGQAQRRGSLQWTYAQVRDVLAVAGHLLRPQRGGCKGAHRHRGARAGGRAHGVAQWPSEGLAQGHCVGCWGGEAACSGVGRGGRVSSLSSSTVNRRPSPVVASCKRARPLLLRELGQARDASAERAFQICFAGPLTPRPPSPASFPLGSSSRSAFVSWSRLPLLHLACPLSPARSPPPPPPRISPVLARRHHHLHRSPAHRTPHIMSRVLQDQFVDDDEEECCPLCVEEFDLSDRNFRPCPCGYQVRAPRKLDDHAVGRAS